MPSVSPSCTKCSRIERDVIVKDVRVVKEAIYASDEDKPSKGHDFGSGARLHRHVRRNWGGDFLDSYGPRKLPQMMGQGLWLSKIAICCRIRRRN